MTESATTPSSRRPLGPSAPITPAQRRALFAAAKSRGLSTDDLRAMTPQRSISQLSAHEAATILQRLNGGSRITASPRRPRRPRRPSNVIALISADQLDLIRKLRISMGWNHLQLGDHMKSRHYPSDPSRTMDLMQTSRDAQAVIEHLKIILHRTLEAAAPPATSPATSPAARRGRTIPQLMQSTAPFPRLLDLLKLRRAELASLGGDPGPQPGDLSCCAAVACAIERIESEISNLKSTSQCNTEAVR